MYVKFHLNGGNTVNIIARDRRNNETDNIADAIRIFKNIIGPDVPFVLDSEIQARSARKVMEARSEVLATLAADDTTKAAGGASELDRVAIVDGPAVVEAVEKPKQDHKAVAAKIISIREARAARDAANKTNANAPKAVLIDG